MKWMFVVLLLLLIGLQARLWVGDGSLSEIVQLKSELQKQQRLVKQLEQRNQVLSERVVELQNGYEAIEEIARKDLGMIKKGETFYQIIKAKKNSADSLKR